MNSKPAHNMKSQMHVTFVGRKGSRASPIIWFVTLLQDVNRLFIRSSCRKKNQHHIWPKIIGQPKLTKGVLNSPTPQSMSNDCIQLRFSWLSRKLTLTTLMSLVSLVLVLCLRLQNIEAGSGGEFLGTLPPIHLPGFRVVGNCKSAAYGCQLHLGTQHPQLPAKQSACLRFTICFSEMSNERDWK